MRICQNCGKQLEKEALFCPDCGTKYEEPEEPRILKCSVCGTVLDADNLFCPECGTKCSNAKSNKTSETQKVSVKAGRSENKALLKNKKFIIGLAGGIAVITIAVVIGAMLTGGKKSKDVNPSALTAEMPEKEDNSGAPAAEISPGADAEAEGESVVMADNIYGAVFDMTLEEFKEKFSNQKTEMIHALAEDDKIQREIMNSRMQSGTGLNYATDEESTGFEGYKEKVTYLDKLNNIMQVMVDKNSGKVIRVDYIPYSTGYLETDIDEWNVECIVRTLGLEHHPEFQEDLESGLYFGDIPETGKYYDGFYVELWEEQSGYKIFSILAISSEVNSSYETGEVDQKTDSPSRVLEEMFEYYEEEGNRDLSQIDYNGYLGNWEIPYSNINIREINESTILFDYYQSNYDGTAVLEAVDCSGVVEGDIAKARIEDSWGNIAEVSMLFSPDKSLYVMTETTQTAEGARIVPSAEGCFVKDTLGLNGSSEKSAEEATVYAGGTEEPEYLFPESNTRYLTDDEILNSGYSVDELELAKNEIYARHGRIFVTPRIADYFNSKSWYQGTIQPEDFDARQGEIFNAYEVANVAKIAELEQQARNSY